LFAEGSEKRDGSHLVKYFNKARGQSPWFILKKLTLLPQLTLQKSGGYIVQLAYLQNCFKTFCIYFWPQQNNVVPLQREKLAFSRGINL